jgi:hypothetical protein
VSTAWRGTRAPTDGADAWRALGADLVMLYPTYRILDFADQVDLPRRFKEVAG